MRSSVLSFLLHGVIIVIGYSRERHHLDTAMSSSDVTRWLNDAARIPLLTKSQEILLGRKVCAWKALPPDGSGLEHKRITDSGIKAQQRLTASNLRLVWKIVTGKYGTRMPTDDLLDLLQAGATGLHRAAFLFDPEKGYAFSTYAKTWILESCQRWQDNYSRPIRVPTTLTNTARRLPKVRAELYRHLHREPTLSELAAGLNKPVPEIALLIQRMRPVSSLDQPMHSSVDCTLADTIAAPASSWDHTEQQAFAERLRLLSNHSVRSVTPIRDAHQLDLALS
jgi:RNA polymerase sigma factor (sigma-70 family)